VTAANVVEELRQPVFGERFFFVSPSISFVV